MKDLPYQLDASRDVHRLAGCNAFLMAKNLDTIMLDCPMILRDTLSYFLWLCYGVYGNSVWV